MDIDYDSVTALVAVVREGSFDSAARSLHVTQSAISQRIKILEEKMGSPLVVRGRPCVPTEAGLHLCHHFEQVSLLEHELQQRMNILSEFGNQGSATVRISVNSDSLATWFPNVVKRATDELNMRFEVIPDDQDYTEQNLKSGNALAVITAIERPVQGCRRLSLGAMEYMAVASKQFIEERLSGQVSVSTMRKATALVFDRKDALPERWMELCFDEKVVPPKNMIPSYDGYLACCLNGTGWGMMPTVSVEPIVESGDLTELRPGKRIKISLHWQSSTQSSEILRMLGDIVASEARIYLLPDEFRE